MRRSRGQAADLILKTVTEAHPKGLTLAELRDRTRLPAATVTDNVNALRKRGKVQTSKDENRALWVCLSE